MTSSNPPPSKPALAILDDYFSTATPKLAHLSSKLTVQSFPDTLSDCEHDREKQIARLTPFAVISTMRERTKFPAPVLGSLPNLRLLLTTGTRNASIDLPACRELGITVAGATGEGRSDAPTSPRINGLDTTVEHTFALILALARNIVTDDEVVRRGGWQTSPAIGLKGKTLGIIGLGSLGMTTAKIAKLGFGMEVYAWSSSLTQQVADEKAEACGLPRGSFRAAVGKEEVLREADVVSLHYVLSERSRGMIGERELGLMKKGAMLINTSRGPLVGEEALLKVLKEGRIGGAALDVYDTEPLGRDSEWRTTRWGEEGRSRVVLSPHMGYVEEEVMDRWYDETVENVERWLEGRELRNVMT